MAQLLFLYSLLLIASPAPARAQDVHDGCVHMQIIHSTNQQYFSKRAVEFTLANRSDVAYYAKRTALSPTPRLPRGTTVKLTRT